MGRPDKKKPGQGSDHGGGQRSVSYSETARNPPPAAHPNRPGSPSSGGNQSSKRKERETPVKGDSSSRGGARSGSSADGAGRATQQKGTNAAARADKAQRAKPSSTNPYTPLASEDEEPEEGAVLAKEGDASDEEADGSALSRDILENLTQDGAVSGLVPGSALEKLVIKALTKAIAENTTPASWILQLALGTKNPADIDVRVTKVTPRSLSADLSAETNSSRVRPPAATSANPETRSSPSVPQTNSVNPDTNTVNPGSVSSKPFTLKNADLPADLKLEGLPSEDVPEKMTLYKAHIRLLSHDEVSEDTINHRAIKHLALFVRGAAAKSLSLMLSNALEWRPETQLAALRNQGVRITPRSPRTWDEWVTAFTTLFAPANRISLLARDVMTLQAKSDESVDEYALRVSQAYSRLLAEAERTAPPNTSSYEHAFNQALIASYENGLQPEIRVEMIREDASQSFMASKARARKHEANKLRSAASPSSTAVSSLYHPPQLEDVAARLEQRLDRLEGQADQHVASVQRSRDHGRSGGGDKRPRSQSRGPRQDSHKAKVSFQSGAKSDKAGGKKRGVSEPCDFVGCRYNSNRFSHTRADCKTEARAKEDGYKVSHG